MFGGVIVSRGLSVRPMFAKQEANSEYFSLSCLECAASSPAVRFASS